MILDFYVPQDGAKKWGKVKQTPPPKFYPKYAHFEGSSKCPFANPECPYFGYFVHAPGSDPCKMGILFPLWVYYGHISQILRPGAERSNVREENLHILDIFLA